MQCFHQCFVVISRSLPTRLNPRISSAFKSTCTADVLLRSHYCPPAIQSLAAGAPSDDLPQLRNPTSRSRVHECRWETRNGDCTRLQLMADKALTCVSRHANNPRADMILVNTIAIRSNATSNYQWHLPKNSLWQYEQPNRFDPGLWCRSWYPCGQSSAQRRLSGGDSISISDRGAEQW